MKQEEQRLKKQILKNQVTIMRFLLFGFKEINTDGILAESMIGRIKETDALNDEGVNKNV